MTRTPPPAQAANDYRTLAAILADGRWRRALELADANASPLRAAGGGGGASIGTHADPTAAAALSRLEPMPSAAELVSAYDGLRVAMGVRGGSSVHWTAGRLEGHAKLLVNEHRRPANWPTVWLWVDRCLRLHAQVITPDSAAAHLQRKASEQAARYCLVCEAPLTVDERRSMCGADYWLWRDRGSIRHLFTEAAEGDPGADRAAFVRWVRARIADPLHPDNHGIAMLRPGSPLVPDTMPTLHERP